MSLKKIFERKGFRELIVKSVVFVVLLVVMEVLCAPHALGGHLPGELKPFSFLQMGEAMLFVLALFVIYNRAKLYSVDAYGVRDLRLLPLSFCMLARTSFCFCILRTRGLPTAKSGLEWNHIGKACALREQANPCFCMDFV